MGYKKEALRSEYKKTLTALNGKVPSEKTLNNATSGVNAWKTLDYLKTLLPKNKNPQNPNVYNFGDVKDETGQLVPNMKPALFTDKSVNDLIDYTYATEFQRMPTEAEQRALRTSIQIGQVSNTELPTVISDKNLKNGEISLSLSNSIKDITKLGTGKDISPSELAFYKNELISGTLAPSDLTKAIASANGDSFNNEAVRQNLTDTMLKDRLGYDSGMKPFSYTPKGIDPFTYQQKTNIPDGQFKPFNFQQKLDTPTPVGEFKFDSSGLKTNYDPNKKFTFNQDDPSYKFRQEQAQLALERGASSRGNLLSGGQIKGAERYASDLASQEYNNAFNRFNTSQQLDANAYNTEYQQAMNNQLAGYNSQQQNYQNAVTQDQRDYQNQLTSYGTNSANNQLNRQQEQIDYNRQLSEYNIGVGQEQQRYNRKFGEYNQKLNQLNSLAGYGANAVGAQQNASSNFGSATGNALTNQGNVNAQTAITQGNATANLYANTAGSINTGISNYLTASMLKPAKPAKPVKPIY